MGDDGFQRLRIACRLGRSETQLRRYFLDLRQTKRLQDADIHPADIEFEPAVR